MNTIKNAHSPAGMTYCARGAYWKNLTDCPVCKYGTLDPLFDKDGLRIGMRCADCKRQFTTDSLIKLGVIKKP